MDFVRSHGISVVRRATGGGAVYHDAGNINYSLIGDAGDSSSFSLARFMEPVCAALRSLGVPAEATGRNDIAVNGLKVSGTAQRLSGSRVLHHGTLLFTTDRETMSAALRPDPGKFESKAAKSVRSRVGQICDFRPEGTTVEDFRRAMLAALGASGLVRESLAPGELAAVGVLAEEKYRSYEWTWGRAPDFGFRSRRRFPGGSMEVRLDIHAGHIRDAAFAGDFMAMTGWDRAREALSGRRFERGDVRAALEGLPLREMFGGITLGEILTLMFGEDAEDEGL